MVTILVLNYVPHTSDLYANILFYLSTTLNDKSEAIGSKNAKLYTNLISSIEKRTVTKNHTIKPKLSKEAKKYIKGTFYDFQLFLHLEYTENTELYKWHDEDDENSIYGQFTKTTNSFRLMFQPWYEMWRLMISKWDSVEKRDIVLNRIQDIEAELLSTHIK